MARRFAIVGNWKMNLGLEDARALARAVGELAAAHPSVDVGVAPAAPWLLPVSDAAAGRCAVYAQNVSQHEKGAFTGEWSTGMLQSGGIGGTLVGHSERRTHFGEGDVVIGEKVRRALGAGLQTILCFGETLEQREAGKTWDVVSTQLSAGLEGVEDVSTLVLAYEPVWAIGTGKTATPEQAQEVHAQIRAWLRERFDDATAATLRVQYGGSVKPANAAELLAMPDIDGALVGGASLKAETFGPIVEAAAAAS